jgi:hypothetical protein
VNFVLVMQVGKEKKDTAPMYNVAFSLHVHTRTYILLTYARQHFCRSDEYLYVTPKSAVPAWVTAHHYHAAHSSLSSAVCSVTFSACAVQVGLSALYVSLNSR